MSSRNFVVKWWICGNLVQRLWPRSCSAMETITNRTLLFGLIYHWALEIFQLWNNKLKSPFLKKNLLQHCLFSKLKLQSSDTDLGSLIWNFDYGYSTMWEFSDFPGILVLREFNSDWFQKVDICRFNNHEGLELWFLENFTLENVKSFQESKIQKC